MKRRAFTLIELAMVLAIVGILVGGGFKVLKMQRTKADIAKAKENVKISKDAIIGFAMEYIDLPTWSEFNTSLSPINSTDLNASFFYFAAPELHNDIDICSFNETTLEIRVYEGSTFLKTIPNIAFVVASESANKNIQTDAYSSGGKYIINTYRGATQADDNGADYTDASEIYDDVIQFVTLSELQQQIDCNSNKLEILNNESFEGNATQIYNPQIIAAKGNTFSDGGDSDSLDDYKWCIMSNSTEIQTKMEYQCNGTHNITNSCPTYNQCTSPVLQVKTLMSLTTGNYPVDINVSDQAVTPVHKTLLLRITP